LYSPTSVDIYVSSVPSVIPEYFLLSVTITNNGAAAITPVSPIQNMFQNINWLFNNGGLFVQKFGQSLPVFSNTITSEQFQEIAPNMNISIAWATTGNTIAVGASATYIFKVGLWLKSSKLWLGALANGLTARLFSAQTGCLTDLTKTGAVVSNMTLFVVGKQVSMNIQKQLSTLY
jgi:hypothetical protein